MVFENGLCLSKNLQGENQFVGERKREMGDTYLGSLLEGLTKDGEGKGDMRMMEIEQYREKGRWIFVMFPTVIPYNVDRRRGIRSKLKGNEWRGSAENLLVELGMKESVGGIIPTCRGKYKTEHLGSI